MQILPVTTMHPVDKRTAPSLLSRRTRGLTNVSTEGSPLCATPQQACRKTPRKKRSTRVCKDLLAQALRHQQPPVVSLVLYSTPIWCVCITKGLRRWQAPCSCMSPSTQHTAHICQRVRPPVRPEGRCRQQCANQQAMRGSRRGAGPALAWTTINFRPGEPKEHKPEHTKTRRLGAWQWVHGSRPTPQPGWPLKIEEGELGAQEGRSGRLQEEKLIPGEPF